MINSQSLKAFIEAEGWTNHGVVDIAEVQSALNTHEEVFERWLSRGFQADMDYLENMQEDRFHPENKLPDVKSVIVLMAWYSSEQKSCSTDEGEVARYARGRDYHKILKKRLIRLSKWLKEQDGGVETYLSVDSGPTVDRVLAKTAGLGFFGKNANIIDPRKGSYFFIASLMVNRSLEPTEKGRLPSCGDCTKCMVACPTNAIVAPGVIDARRCISYLTIENKGGIPLELRDKIGNRLFGCDICQEVCPFNEGRAHQQEITIDEIGPASGCGSHLHLTEILEIETDEAFLEKFAGTPLMRAKRRGLQRNACVVAGNSGHKPFIKALEAFIERETDEMLIEHAQWGIERLNT